MLGLCGTIIVQLLLIWLISCWIKWEMQHKEKRVAFTTQAWNDLVAVIAKNLGQIPSRKFRSVLENSILHR